VIVKKLVRRIGSGVGGAALAAGVLVAGAAAADESCREWRSEHRRWKTVALRHYLRGAPQRELDAAVFEVLQREAYLSSCEVSVEGGLADLVGWRLVGRDPAEYGSAVAESVLERAGFDVGLQSLFQRRPERIASTPERIASTPERIASTPERIASTPERIASTQPLRRTSR
jgi:hypothetical protein